MKKTNNKKSKIKKNKITYIVYSYNSLMGNFRLNMVVNVM